VVVNAIVDTLKTVVYILNWVPFTAAPKTPFKLFNDLKPSLRHMRVWGCPSEVRIYNPQEKKLVGISLDMPNSLNVIDSIVHLTQLGLWGQEMQSFLKIT
jgi:hypothetical protein